MRYLSINARIIASWQTCCVCNYERGSPPTGEAFSTEPRFNFKHEAQQYAEDNGMEIIAWNKYKSALAMLPIKCSHRDQQHVRLSWELVGNNSDALKQLAVVCGNHPYENGE